jgi:hypothetical protein
LKKHAPRAAERLTEAIFTARGWITGEQIRDRRMIQMRAQRPFQGRMDLGQESADPVGSRRDLPGEVVVETAEHSEFGQ